MMSNGKSKLDALPHPFAVARDAAVSGFGHMHLLDCLPCQFIGSLSVEAVQPKQGTDESKTRDTFRKRIELGAVADVAIESLGIIRPRAENLDVAARWPDQSR